MSIFARALALTLMFPLFALGQDGMKYKPSEGDFITHNFKFHSGEQLADLRLHYRTLGQPVRAANGQVSNAVLLLHGTGGSGAQFLVPQFADELFGPGNRLISPVTSSSHPTALGTESRRSQAMVCTPIFRNMITTIWCRRSICS